MTPPGRLLIVAVILAGAACSQADPQPVIETRGPARAPVAEASRSAASDAPKIVILGDSLTAGLGLEPEQSFPSLLQDRLDAAGYRYQVVNAGVSGDTSAGGRRRLDWALEGDVRVLVLELGANDGLRGLPVEDMKKNLGEIIERAQQRGIAVVLAGMEAPPNYGAQYTAEFRQAFRDLATQYNVPLIPFLLDGVAGIRELNRGDGIHPNAEGARIVARTVWAALEPVLETAPTR